MKENKDIEAESAGQDQTAHFVQSDHALHAPEKKKKSIALKDMVRLHGINEPVFEIFYKNSFLFHYIMVTSAPIRVFHEFLFTSTL